jgi:hypothetical protein
MAIVCPRGYRPDETEDGLITRTWVNNKGMPHATTGKLRASLVELLNSTSSKKNLGKKTKKN